MILPQASPATTFLFSLVVFGVLLLLHHSLGRPGIPASGRRWQFPLIVAAGLVLPGSLVHAGRLQPEAMPLLLLLLGCITTGTVMLARSATGRALADTLPLAALVGFQAFRIPVEWLLHRLCTEGLVPPVMTWSGRDLDVLSGALALVLAYLLASGRCHARWVLVWNGLGLALLANIVVLSVLAAPVPFRQFVDEPLNRLPVTFPFIWLPTVLVQAALLGHLLVFRALVTQGAGGNRNTGRPDARDTSGGHLLP